MAQKISYWLLITLVLSLGFGQLLRFDFFGLSFYLHDLLILPILCLHFCKDRNFAIPVGLKLFFLGLAIGWARALTLYSVSELAIPALYSLRLLVYLGLFLTLKNSKIQLPKSTFMIAGAITLVIGLLQYFLLPDMRIFQYLGWDDHLYRLTLPHFDPTFTAVMLVFLLLSTSSLPYLLVPIIFLAILLTYSRSVWLSLLFTSILFIRNKLILLLAVSFLLLAILFLPKKFGEGTNLFRTYSITSRIQSDIAYLKKYSWDLLIGRGMNTMILDSSTFKKESHATGPNNSYLYLLATTGIVGLLGWGMFIYFLYQKSRYKPLMIFFLLASLFNNIMFYPFSLLWILLIETQQKKI